MYISETERKLLRLNLQFFGESDAGNATSTDGAGAEGGEKQPTNENQNPTFTQEALEKLIQSRVDKSNAELGKKIAELQKENDKLKKDKMTADEVKEFEMSERQKELDKRDKEITDKTNRLYAVQAASKAGLDLGKDLEYLDCIMGENEESIDNKVKAVKSWVESLVSARVAETFKANGRVPNGGSKGGEEKPNIAAELGKRAAETAQKSNDILKHYYGG